MDKVTRVERAATFGANPEDYDAVRPGYPAEVFQRIGSYAALKPGAHVLEIGCGTGQATRSLVDLDVLLTCLEPSSTLSQVAQRNFSDCSNVEVHEVDFESFQTPIIFDLVMAATSFHWIDPEVRLSKSASLLKEGGALAIVTNIHPPPYTGFFEAVQGCYNRHVPEWSERRQPDFSWDQGSKLSYEEELRADSRFIDVEVHQCDWHVDFTANQYRRLLHTFSDHIRLGAERLDALASDVSKLIDEEYDGVIHRPYRSVLRLARTTASQRN